VNVAGGNITSGPSAANQTATNGAASSATNNAATYQLAHADQTGGGSSCKYGCGGAGQYQLVFQGAATLQYANSNATANQNAVNSNAPVSTAGGNIASGPSAANQTATNGAISSAYNAALTGQFALALQSL